MVLFKVSVVLCYVFNVYYMMNRKFVSISGLRHILCVVSRFAFCYVTYCTVAAGYLP